MRAFRTVLFSAVFSLAFLASSVFAQTPKYIFLFIGDGMGASQRELAERVSVQADLGKLEMNHFPVCGKANTNSLNGVTDSAAAGTALSCGVKTNNHMLGVTPDGKAVDSITVDAKKAGWKVGDISSVFLNHATPAVFYAHHQNRKEYADIFTQATTSQIDFFGGPGFSGTKEPVEKALTDGGYEVSLGKINQDKLPKLPCAILDSPTGGNLEYRYGCNDKTYKRDHDTLSLADITQAAITLLYNPKGFFIMIEGGAIDWACHANNFPDAVWETIDMNDAVRVALKFYEQHPDETLIVVTADHETGGLTIVKDVAPEILLTVKSPEEVNDIVKNIAKKKPDGKEFVLKIAKNIGLKTISDKDRKTLLDLYVKKRLDPQKDKTSVTQEVIRLMNAQAGITWKTGWHTGATVPTTAIGAGSKAFKGKYENTHIADRIRSYIKQSSVKRSSHKR